jgi:hypothetical protein
MGLEPTTFCMAKAGERSRPFAPVRRNHLFAATTGRVSERQRTRANAECSHCSHCDRCHVQLAWPGGATPPERPPLTSASVADQSSVGEDFAEIPRPNVRTLRPFRSGRLAPRRTCGGYGASDGALPVVELRRQGWIAAMDVLSPSCSLVDVVVAGAGAQPYLGARTQSPATR